MYASYVSSSLLIIMAIGLCSYVHCNDEGMGETGDALQEKARRFQEMLRHDGVKRTVEVTDKNYANIIKKKDIAIVLFHVDQGGEGGGEQQEKNILEVAAQIFKGKVLCAFCNIVKNPSAMQKAGVLYADTIVIFNQERESVYYGQRTPDIFIPYVSKLFEPIVTFINSKAEKKQFDNQEIPKSVSYVSKGSPEERILANVARHFQPTIKFYAVADAKIAKSLHLKKINTLLFAKPFERSLTMPAKVTWNEKSITTYIKENKKQIVQKLQLENIHEAWAVDTKGYIVPIFAAGTSQAGKRFLSLIKSIAKKYKESEELNFVWIDPEAFPMMGKYWQDTFGVDPSLPTLGAIEMSTQKAAWLELKVIDKRSEQKVKQWLDSLIKGDIVLTSIQVPPSTNTDSTPDSTESSKESMEDNKDEL